MKKLFYVLLIAGFSAMTFTSCTEEEVTPNTEADSNSGAPSEEIRK
jgi:hypothetical protein